MCVVTKNFVLFITPVSHTHTFDDNDDTIFTLRGKKLRSTCVCGGLFFMYLFGHTQRDFFFK